MGGRKPLGTADGSDLDLLMKPGTKRIAVLFHERDRETPLSSYIVDHLARYWREDGHEVVYLFGTKSHVPADLILVHVDLSVVPGKYLAFASRYPIVLNGQVRDIRKSLVSTNLVRARDSWTGPVIVKTDLNYAGKPERARTPKWLEKRPRLLRTARRARAWLTGREDLPEFTDYLIFESANEVPVGLSRRKDVVVERFLPERENNLFHLRMCQVLGDRRISTRVASHQPVIKAGTSVSSEPIEPHPEVETWRKRFNLDYGKLDYFVHDGRAVLIDVNKTIGASRQVADAPLQAMRRHLAEGLYTYFG
jgi:hypothetical protein